MTKNFCNENAVIKGSGLLKMKDDCTLGSASVLGQVQKPEVVEVSYVRFQTPVDIDGDEYVSVVANHELLEIARITISVSYASRCVYIHFCGGRCVVPFENVANVG